MPKPAELKPYYAACCQVKSPNRTTREGVKKQFEHMAEMVDYAVEQFEELYPVKWVGFPELCWQGFPFLSHKENYDVAIEVPGEMTDILAEKADKYNIYISAGSGFEKDEEWSNNLVFNSYPLIGPDGDVLFNYRKVNPWWPLEFSLSPYDLLDEGYDKPLFPVHKNDEIGNIGHYICYDGWFPEVTRELTVEGGAEILSRCSAYMDPWGSRPTDNWELVNRVRSIENMAYSFCVQQGSSLDDFPPFSWPGGSMIVDYEGRPLTKAQEGERIVGAKVNLGELRDYRRQVLQHNMLAHNKNEAYNFLDHKGWIKRPEYATADDLNLKDSRQHTEEVCEEYYKREHPKYIENYEKELQRYFTGPKKESEE